MELQCVSSRIKSLLPMYACVDLIRSTSFNAWSSFKGNLFESDTAVRPPPNARLGSLTFFPRALLRGPMDMLIFYWETEHRRAESRSVIDCGLSFDNYSGSSGCFWNFICENWTLGVSFTMNCGIFTSWTLLKCSGTPLTETAMVVGPSEYVEY